MQAIQIISVCLAIIHSTQVCYSIKLFGKSGICNNSTLTKEAFKTEVENRHFRNKADIQDALFAASNFYEYSAGQYCTAAEGHSKKDEKCNQEFQQMLINNLGLNGREALACCYSYQFVVNQRSTRHKSRDDYSADWHGNDFCKNWTPHFRLISIEDSFDKCIRDSYCHSERSLNYIISSYERCEEN